MEHYNCLNPPSLNFSEKKQDFDFIISNPPYFKLPKEDNRVKAAQIIIDGQPNIYSIFLAFATRMLKADGEMIFIVPRSFTSGRYFNSFRNYFFNYVQINFIHLFESRKDTFSRDDVLQETLILKAKPKNSKGIAPQIVVSTCSGLQDIEQSKRKTYLQKDLIDLKSKEKIIHLPTNTKEEAIIDLFKSWSGSLNQYNIQISTGPVVAFRMEDCIKETPEEETVSLYWLHNVTKMEVNYPLQKSNKGQYIQICEQTKSYLIPNRNYIFL
jgi:adenine-specific DNA-methyltransferase